MSQRWAEQYIGIPWLTGGRDVYIGLDCWGLLRHVYSEEFKIQLSEHAAKLGHLAEWKSVAFDELTSNSWQQTEEPIDGDAVALGQNGAFSHVGVYLCLDGVPCMIHTARKELSSIIPIRRLEMLGWTTRRYYRHADRS